jgi:TolB protein
MRARRPLATALATVALATFALVPATSQPPAAGAEEALPTEMVTIDIDAAEASVYRMGIPDLIGGAPHVTDAGGVLRNDFRLMPGYRVIDPRSIRHDLRAEGLSLDRGAWGALSANGVIKGEVWVEGSSVRLEMRFFEMARGNTASLSRTYAGAPSEIRRWMHDFGNEVLFTISGVRGVFGTPITYARREGQGRKDVFVADMDGFGVRRVSAGQGISMLPAFDATGRVWFTRLTPRGVYITNNQAGDARVITADGLNMAPAPCGDRILFSSSRDGNSEIYSARTDGSDVRRLTRHPAIDVSPSCGPDGRIAFVSARHGSPQVWVMNADGGDPRRITFRGNHNQTPAWCPLPGRQQLAFTGRDGTLDVFTLDLGTGAYTRLTQGQGSNKDPTWSPDCRLLAFVSDRRRAPGVYLASPQGYNQSRVVEGAAETVRWSPPARDPSTAVLAAPVSPVPVTTMR